MLNALSVIMKNTQPITRLRSVVDCIFGTAIFGGEVTKVVLGEVYKQIIFTHHQNTFSVGMY